MNTLPALDGAVALTHWGVIRAAGADAASFLHSQLTSDIEGLDTSRAQLAGFCSAKGRLLASFVVWRSGPEEILLACHASVLAATLKRLSMFVLRARCKLSDASAELRLHGVVGASAETLAGSALPWQRSGDVIRLPDAQGLRRGLRVSDEESPALPAIELDAWRWLEVESGIPMIEAATQDRFVPQMINFELVGGVNFQKGCYPGQEVVARSQYRGTTKRRMFLFDLASQAQPGQEVFHSDDPAQPAGLVANAAPRRDAAGSSALVELKLAALDGGSLQLGAADGPVLVRRELPYALPIDTTTTS
jgi:folate-binding protein YgfZ